MGLSKTEIFTDKQNQIATIAKTLGHPARIAILQHLVNKKACICGDLVDEIGLAQATISQHLKALKQVGIIQGDIDGPRVCYCINQAAWQEIKTILSQFFDIDFETNSNCC